MEKIRCDYISMVASIVPIFKDKNRSKSCYRETENKQIHDKEICFGEVLNKAISNRK